MCAHSSSGIEITEKIGGKLYPLIDSLLKEVNTNISHTSFCNDAERMLEQIFKLRSEFESLKNYELKLVFPSVLRVFNTKDKPEMQSGINVAELQSLTRNKEQLILDLVQDIETEAEIIQLRKDHPVFAMVLTFQTSFVEDKEQWHQMLLSWNKSCACFSNASNNILNEKMN